MNESETIECMTVMADLFPQSELTAPELKLFADTISAYDRDRTVASIKKYRLLARYNRPDFNAILADMNKHGTARDAQRGNYRTSTARAFVAIHSWAQGKAEREVVLRNYSMLFWRMLKDADGNLRAAVQVERYKKVFARECQMDLIGAGCDETDAANLVGWLDCPVRELDAMLAGLEVAA